MDAVQQRLAQYVHGVATEAIPPAALHEACVRVVDTLGALIGGFNDEPCCIARALAADMPVAGGSSVFATRLRVPVDVAAFVNGVAARSAEINDVYHRPGSKNGHPSDVIMPIYAVAEHVHANGRAFLAAVVLAYEIYLRFADQFASRAFDATNFCGIGVAAASARLLGLSQAHIAEAISMAAVPNNALNQTRTGHLTMWKSVAAGQAGRAGVFAALLAQKGMRGPHEPFGGKHGWCNNVAGKALSFDVMGGAADEFRIHDTIIKPRMACLHTLAPILAAEKAATRLAGRIGDIERVTVEVYRANERAVATLEKAGSSDHHWNPDSRETADHSIPYCVAATLRDGSMTTRSFDAAHLADPLLRGVLNKTELVENPAYTAAYEKMPVEYRCRVTAHLRGGETFTGETGGEHGDLSEYKPDDAISAKFTGFVAPVFGAQHTARLLENLWRLESLTDVAQIAPLFMDNKS